MTRLAVALLALALPLGATAARAAPSGGTPVAFVSAEHDDRLVAVAVGSGRVLARIPVGDGPHNVAAGRGLRYVLVTSPPAGVVTLVDAFTRRVVNVYRGLRSPHDVEFAPGRAPFAYVTEERGGTLAVLSLSSGRIVRRVAVGRGPHDLAVSPDGSRVWVTHGRGFPSITIVATDRPDGARVVGSAGARGAHDIAFAPDGRSVWVTYWDSGLVGRIRAYRRTGRLRLQERVGRLVHHVQTDAVTGEVWTTDHMTGRTALVSARSGRVRRAVSGCPGAHHAAFVGTASVVVVCQDADGIAVYDRRTWRPRLVRVGRHPHGVAVAVVP